MRSGAPRVALAAWTTIVLVFLYLPIVLLIFYSFNASRLNIRWGGFSLAWYAYLFRETDLLRALYNSLWIATATTIISVPLGVAAAWALYRYRLRFAPAIHLLAMIPIAMPEIIMGVSLLAFFALVSRATSGLLSLGYSTVVISHVTFCFPFVMVVVRARLAGLDPALEEAAMDLGATPARAFFRVIVPFLMPAVIAGALMSFTLSMDELIVTYFTAGPGSITLPVKAFGMARVGMNPSLNAISTLLIVATAILMALADLFRRRAIVR
ncbi:spermidine/putrescine ABC transporter permease PotC [soil metagenome]